MSGFAGIIGACAGDGAFASVIKRMAGCLMHEAHHCGDSALVPSLQMGVGWVWDSEAGGVAAAWNERRDVFLVFNGEEFSGVSRAASGNGNEPGQSARRLIELYEQNGARFLISLNGWFSGLLVDLRAQRVLLFNDRFGQSRIYYSQTEDGFYFGSEAKSLLAALPGLRQMDERGLAEFFAVGCALQNRTLFRDIALLPPGSAWSFHRDGRIDKARYFEPGVWEDQEALDRESYQEQLNEIFGRIAPRYLIGGAKVGMSLTGGLDSRAILAWAPLDPASLPCYTFSGPYRDCADVRIARQLASACGQVHSTIRVGDDFYRDFSALAEKAVYVTDGAMDVSGAIEIYVNRKARQIAPIRVTGNYGSEILRSNVAFRPGQVDRSLFMPEFARLVDEAADTYRSEAAGHRLTFIAFKQVPWHHHARKALEQSQLTVRSPFLDNELVALAYRAPRELASSPQPLLRLMAEGNPALESIPTDRAYRRAAMTLFSGMAKAWQEFTAKAEYAYDYGMPARLARIDHAISRLRAERLFLGRHKFYHFRVWYKKQLRGYLEGFCDNLRRPSCYRPGAAERLIQGHLSGRDNHTLQLHKLFSVQLMEQVLLRPV